MKEKLLTVKEICVELSISVRQARRLLRLSEIPFIRMGFGRGSIRVKESDLEAYIERKRNGKSLERDI